MKYKIVTAVFDYPGENEYTRCVKALENSVKANCPNAELNILRIKPPTYHLPRNKHGWTNNHEKLKAYSEVKIDKPTFFIDADTIVLKDLAPLIGDFDIAIAERPKGAKAPFNMGVVLFMPGDWPTCFMSDWIKNDKSMLEDYDFHMKYRSKYSGQNQSSFGFLYENYGHLYSIKKYPTKLINACEQDWGDTSESYIIHVKTRLRKAALGSVKTGFINPKLRKEVELWRHYETNSSSFLVR